MRDSFVFMKQWWEGLAPLPPKDLAEAITAIMNYALKEETYSGNNVAVILLMGMVKKQIDENNTRYQEICEKRRKAIESRWRGDTNEYKSIQMNTNEYTSTQVNTDSDNDSDSVYDSVSDNDNILKETFTPKGDKSKEKPSKFDIKTYLKERGVCDQYIEEWLLVRKTKRGTNTETAMKKIGKEIAMASLSWNDAIKFCIENDWVGFKYDWYRQRQINKQKIQEYDKQRGTEPADFSHPTEETFKF